MAHSLLSPALNLGLLHPLEVARAAEAAWRQGLAPLPSAEGFIRQVIGWREYVWGTYWFFGESYRSANHFRATRPVPRWLAELDAASVSATCLQVSLRDLRRWGWLHHIPRLMVLANWALQRGIDPAAMTDWFHAAFVDGYAWVMAPNVIGMGLWADGGRMMTKPYLAGGAYINRMSDYCQTCPYDPRVRLGPRACPFTAGYWAFLDQHEAGLRGNHRMAQPLAALARLADRAAIREQEATRDGVLAP